MLEQVIAQIGPLEQQAMADAQKQWNALAKPLGSLGRLESMVVQLAGITGRADYRPLRRCVVVMCADNGVVCEGVTQTGQEVTALVTGNLAKGLAAVNLLACSAGADVLPVDVGVAQAVDTPGVLDRKVALGTANMAKGPAMSRQQARQALAVGIDLARTLKEAGYQLLITGEMGIGNTTTSSALAAFWLGLSPEAVTGRGAGLSSAGLARKRQVIAQSIAVNAPDEHDPLDALAKLGGFDIAALAGLYLGGAAYRIPVLMDGVIAAVAALAALRLVPAVQPYLLASHLSKEPAGRLVMEALGLQPMLHADMCLGEGTGAVALLPVLDMAYELYFHLNRFADLPMQAYQPLA